MTTRPEPPDQDELVDFGYLVGKTIAKIKSDDGNSVDLWVRDLSPDGFVRNHVVRIYSRDSNLQLIKVACPRV